MDTINEEFLRAEIVDARITLNHNIAELIKAENGIEQLKESIAATRGAINAFEYLIQKGFKEKEPEKETPPMTLEDIEEMTGGEIKEVVIHKPDDSDSGEEA